MKRVLVILLLLGLIFVGCDSIGLGGDDGGSDSVDTEVEQQAEEEAVESINTVVNEMSSLDFSDPTAATEEMETQMKDLDKSFDDLLSANPDNPVGNLGKALTGMAMMSFDEDVQAALPSELLNSTSRAFSLDFTSTDSFRALQDRSVSVDSWIDIIETKVLPQLKVSLDYLDTAIENMGDETILITSDVASDYNEAGEIEIDKSDLYIPKAGLNFLKGAVEFLLTWDYSMVDENGESIDIAEQYAAGNLTEEEIMEILLLNIDASSTVADTSNFLSFYKSDYLTDSKNSFLAVVQAVKDFDASVRAEEDDQTNDLIPNTDLEIPAAEQTEIEAEIYSNVGIDADITYISDIAGVIGDIIAGTEVITVETEYVTDPETGATSSINLVVDISKLFALDTDDGLRAFLPALDLESEQFISFPEGYDFSFGGILQTDSRDLTEDEFTGLIMSIMM